MREWLSSARIRRISCGGVVTSIATTSVRGTVTSRARLSESSKIDRMSWGAPLSTPAVLAACAASRFSSSSSGGGGASNRMRPPKGRTMRFSAPTSRRSSG